jgi:hypothetical protein
VIWIILGILAFMLGQPLIAFLLIVAGAIGGRR